MSKYIDYAYKIIQLCEKRDMKNLRLLISEAEEYFLETKEYEKIIRIHLELHSQMEYIGNIEYIIEYLLRFLIFYEDLDFDKGRDHYLSTQGYLNYILCDYQSALKSAEEALEEAKVNNNIISKYATMSNIAMLYVKMEDYETAMEKIDEAVSTLGEFGLKEWYFYTSLLLSRSQCYMHFGEFDKAISDLRDVTKTDSYDSSTLQKMEYDHVMGRYTYLTGDYERSLEFYKRSISVAEKKNIFYEFKDLYYGIAKVLFKLEFIEESDIYKEKADDMTRENIDQANQSAIQKANLAIEIDQKIKDANTKDKYNKNRPVLNTQKFDELTEVLNKDYILRELNESYRNMELEALPKLLILNIENMKTIIKETTPIYGDKFIYEVSKVIKRNVDDYTIGRLDVSRFIIVYSLVDNTIFKDEVKWLLTNLSETTIDISDTKYNIEISHTIIDLCKHVKEEQLQEFDIYTIIK